MPSCNVYLYKLPRMPFHFIVTTLSGKSHLLGPCYSLNPWHSLFEHYSDSPSYTVLRLVGWLLHLMVQVVFSCRNGICKPESSPYILCAVKGFNACSCHVQQPHGRTPEKLLQMLAPSKCQIIDQICFEVSVSFTREEQAYPTTATQGL